VRLIKMLGLAVTAAAIVMAFVGATSAMAVTELEEVVNCKVKTDPCPAGSSWGSGTIIQGEATNPELLSSLGTIKCASSATGGKQTQALAHGTIETLSFTKCLLGTSPCTVTPERLNYLVLVLLDTNMDGGYHAVVSNGGNGSPQAHVYCGSLVDCVFSAAEVLFSIALMEHDTSWTVNQALGRLGGICPSTSTWQATYLVRCLSPAGTFVDCFPKMES